MSSPTPELRPEGYVLDDLGYLDEPEAAAALGIKPATLVKYRKDGKGPPYAVVGRRYIYQREGVREWLANGGTRTVEAD